MVEIWVCRATDSKRARQKFETVHSPPWHAPNLANVKRQQMLSLRARGIKRIGSGE
jgi:hypothetical protein